MTTPTVVFVHIPKAAGSTLRGVMVRQYDPAETHVIRLPIWESIAAFKAWPEERRHRVRFLMGHMPFGLHEWLRSPTTYVTMIREPVERVISHFHFVKGYPDHELHDRIRPGMTVGDYVLERTSLELDNGQVRLLSGEPFVEFGSVTRDHLEAAKRNLRERFAVAGVSERFDASLLVMRAALGWRRRIVYLNRNVTREPRTTVTPQDLAAVRDANLHDAELHAFAAARLEEQLRALPAAAVRLAAFRAANAAYSVAGVLARR